MDRLDDRVRRGSEEAVEQMWPTVTALERESVTQWIFDGTLVLADQPSRRADEPRRGRNMARCMLNATGLA